jgi:hypothetical protein
MQASSDRVRWRSIVTETQFATESVLEGIRRVSALPVGWDSERLVHVAYDQTYPLQIGLMLYTSGLERLCKLALACHGLAHDGEFRNVRQFSHRLSNLLDAIEQLDLGRFASRHDAYLTRPNDEFGSELVEWLERFASGGGRYELIDSLARDDAELLTWDTWMAFCARGVVTDDVRLSISVHSGIGSALGDMAIAHDLESAAGQYVESSQRGFSEPAVAVGLAMHRRARWVAAVLDAVTHYTDERLPILSEVTYVLTHPTNDFFMWEIAGLSDREVIMEELTDHLEHFDFPDDGDLDEDEIL